MLSFACLLSCVLVSSTQAVSNPVVTQILPLMGPDPYAPEVVLLGKDFGPSKFSRDLWERFDLSGQQIVALFLLHLKSKHLASIGMAYSFLSCPCKHQWYMWYWLCSLQVTINSEHAFIVQSFSRHSFSRFLAAHFQEPARFVLLENWIFTWITGHFDANKPSSWIHKPDFIVVVYLSHLQRHAFAFSKNTKAVSSVYAAFSLASSPPTHCNG